MNAKTASWLSAHGRLWYGDRWYRLAWIVWPQALGLMLFVTLWIGHPAGQGFIPWAKPLLEAPKAPPAAAPLNNPPNQQVVQPPAVTDVLAPCKSDDHAQAIRDCTALLASGNLQGDNIPYAYYHRGWAYYQTSQYQAAMADYNRAISMQPRAPEFFLDRGALLIDLKNNERALLDLDYAILLKSDYALAYIDRGIALHNLNRQSEALVSFNKAIELDPSQFSAFENRASIYEDISNWRGVYDDGNKMIDSIRTIGSATNIAVTPISKSASRRRRSGILTGPLPSTPARSMAGACGAAPTTFSTSSITPWRISRRRCASIRRTAVLSTSSTT